MKQPSADRTARAVRPSRHALSVLAASFVAAFGLSPGMALAQTGVLPTGAQVVVGSASIDTDGGQMTVTNSSGAVVNWDSFSIGAGNGVHFEQAGSGSKVLNRVVGNDLSSILGTLSSNGEVWLVNPNGVVFGSGATINVGALVASTLGVTNADFAADRLRFGNDSATSPAGQVLNQADISTMGGRVLLVGGTVRNEGVITAYGGKVVLAAGRSIEMVDSGTPNITVRVSAPDNAAVNIGQLLAPDGGSVDLHGAMVNQNGIVRADSMETNLAGRVTMRAQANLELGAESSTSAESRNGAGGRVVAEALDGETRVLGDISVGSVGGAGGQVHLLGRQVYVATASETGINASGASGGQVLIGGSAGGADPAIRDAETTYVDARTSIRANTDSWEEGDGGEIVIRSSGATSVYGSLDVSGGMYGGRGGRIETTGLQLDVRPNWLYGGRGWGESGEWLIHAGDLTVIDDWDESPIPPPVGDSIVSNRAVSWALRDGMRVTLKAGGYGSEAQSGNIVVAAGIEPDDSAVSGGVLRLEAHNDIDLASDVRIFSSGGSMAVHLEADADASGVGDIRLAPRSGIDTGGDALSLSGQRVTLNRATIASGWEWGSGTLAISAAAVTLTNSVLNATGHLRITALNGIGMSDSTLSASAYGDATVLSTDSLATIRNTLSTPQGRWLVYLDSVPEVFDAQAFNDLGYDFVQVGAGATGAPALEGENGVIIRDAMDVQVRVDADREYDGSNYASYSRAVSDNLVAGFGVRQNSEGPIGGRFEDKHAGVGKAVLPLGDDTPFGIVTSTGQDVYGANTTYVADIRQKTITAAGLAALDKVYDATRAATLSGVLEDIVEGDQVTLGAASGLFADKNVGNNKTVTVTGGTLGGADGANYVLGGGTLQADITPLTIGATGLAAADKVYDGSRDATVSGALAGILGGDDVSFGGAIAQFDDKNAGSGKTVTVSGGLLGGDDAGNYVLDSGPILLSASISRRPVDTSSLSARDKVYDGSRDATLDGVVAGFIEDDDVSLDGALAQFDDKNVGENKIVTVSGALLSGADAGNYELGASPSLRASITPRAVAASNLSAQDKIYDGTRDATVTGTLTGVLEGDSVLLEGATGQFADKNAGTGKTVTISGAALAGLDAGNYTLGDTGSGTALADITPRTITAAGLAALDKVYDGGRDAALRGSLSGVLAGDSVSLDGATGLFGDKNVGSGKRVTLSGGVLGGTDAGNYTLDRAATPLSASITARMIDAAGLSARDKVYDGTREATLDGWLSGVIGGDDVSLDGAVATFDDKNVGDSKTVTISGALLGGADAGNYALGASPSLRASITPRIIAATGLSAQDKVYDGTRDATVSGALAGVLAGDSVRLEGATGLFADQNAGQGKTVTISGGALAGTDAGNYKLDGVGGGTAQATITQRAIAADGLAALDKVYDGTRDATLRGSLTGVLAGDSVSLDGATGLFADKNAGSGKTVTVSGATLGGADAGNYVLDAPGGTLQASITPRQLGLVGMNALDKVYDGTRDARVTARLVNTMAGDQVALEASGQFDTRNAGAGKTVTVNGALAGADAANYRLALPATTTANITHRALDIVLTGTVSKEYDATSGASMGGAGFALAGLVAGDQVAVRGPAQGSFANPNAGQGKLVTASGVFEISGGDAANYRVGGIDMGSASNQVTASASGTIGTITPATLVYQANPAATIGGLGGAALGGTVTGFKGGDNLANATTGTLQWTSPANPGSTPGAHPIYGGGLAAQNYVLVQAPGNASALELRPGIAAGAPQQRVQEAGTEAINSAVRSALLQIDPRAVSGTLFDRSSPGAARAFGPLRIGALNQNELAELLAQRRDFKRKLFADAVYKLSIDPSLADVQPCTTIEQASSGSCRITPGQLAMLHAARDKAGASAATPAAGARARLASVPQIERKIAILVGINDYGDKDIPQLENAIADADGVGRVFAEKLGYEVRVAKNPDKAGIIGMLNNLAAEVGGNDSVVIYFAGHGYSLEENGAGYWLASDSTASDPKGWISNSDIAQLLSSMRSKQMTLISDSCYSGAFAREGLGAVGKNVTVDDVLAKRSVVVLSSGGDEPVADEGKGGHSIFAWNLMQVVNSVTAWTPGSTVYADVQAGVRKEFPQTPKYGSLTAAGHQAGGDYLFEMRSN